MMTILARLLMCFVLICLVSCHSYQHTVEQARVLKTCKLTCKSRLQQCQQACRNNCRNCTALANTEAAVHFNQYKRQQCVQGEIVALELKSYRDPLQCRKTTCECKADYGICVQSCQGKIRKRLQAVPAC